MRASPNSLSIGEKTLTTGGNGPNGQIKRQCNSFSGVKDGLDEEASGYT